jgi:hypothetical protein
MGWRPLEWITSQFAHADLMHLVGNLIFLWSFGLVVEGKLGWWRFLLAYLGIGVAANAIEQSLAPASAVGSLGASQAISGLLLMAVIWAPRNSFEMFCLVFIRVFLFEVSILSYGFVFVLLELWNAWRSDFGMSSAILHLIGAAVGAVLGLAMLKFNLVDCEGWDLLTVLAGDEGQPRRSAAQADHRLLDAERRPAPRPAPKTEDVEQRRRAEQARLRAHLEAGRSHEALELHRAMCIQIPRWELAEPELMSLIKSFVQGRDWESALPLMGEFARRFPERSARVRLKLAEILVTAYCRPRKALEVLGPLGADRLPPELELARGKLQRRAQQLIDAGELEADADDL